jgi:hypothetical protein
MITGISIDIGALLFNFKRVAGENESPSPRGRQIHANFFSEMLSRRRLFLLTALLHHRRKNKKRQQRRFYVRPALTSLKTNLFEEFWIYYHSACEDDLKKYIRFTPRQFNDLIALIQLPRRRPTHRWPITNSEMLMMFLRRDSSQFFSYSYPKFAAIYECGYL